MELYALYYDFPVRWEDFLWESEQNPASPRLGFRQEDGACRIYSAVFQMVVSVSE